MSDDPTPTPDPKPEGEPKPETFTQSDVDRIVRERVQRERAKYADYDELKEKAAGARSLEDRVAEIERNAAASEERALRAEVANEKGLTPDQAKRLIGGTRDELLADADLLLKDIGAQKKNGNHVPREGSNPKPGNNSDERAFVRELFSRANAD